MCLEGNSKPKFQWAEDLGEFKTVGEGNRKMVLSAVVKGTGNAGNEGVTSQQIRKATGLGKSAVATHLTHLLQSGSIKKEGPQNKPLYKRAKVSMNPADHV